MSPRIQRCFNRLCVALLRHELLNCPIRVSLRLDSTDISERNTKDLDRSYFGHGAIESNLARVGFTKEQLRLCEGASIPDLIGEDCKLLFVGINPGLQTAMTGIHFAHPSNRFWPALKKAGLIDWTPNLSPVAPSIPIRGMSQGTNLPWTAATQTHFCHPSNRFYPALRRAGLIDFDLDTDIGMTETQRSAFTGSGMGISNLVSRATVRADELSKDELAEGGVRLRSLVANLRPAVVAVAGVTAFRAAFSRPKAALGRQDAIAGAECWVLPNPSGLNAHVTIDGLANWFRQVAKAARL